MAGDADACEALRGRQTCTLRDDPSTVHRRVVLPAEGGGSTRFPAVCAETEDLSAPTTRPSGHGRKKSVRFAHGGQEGNTSGDSNEHLRPDGIPGAGGPAEVTRSVKFAVQEPVDDLCADEKIAHGFSGLSSRFSRFTTVTTDAYSDCNSSRTNRTTGTTNTLLSIRSEVSEASKRSRLGKTRRMSHVQVLPLEIDPGLLRAVPVTEALSGFGKHLASIAAQEEDYDLSEPVTELDDFLSHDWGTGRFEKVVSLCSLYNRRAASIVSCALAFPLAFIGAIAPVPMFQECAAQAVCPIIYYATFFFGQRILSLFGRRKYIFLDKLCIHQTDCDKKSAGILGLAGFLRASRRLVVLWSPRYFSRLWCTYELVTWCYLRGLDATNVRFVPIASCIMQYHATMCFVGVRVIFNFLLVLHGPWAMTTYLLAAAVSFVIFLSLGYKTAYLIQELRQIHRQVEGFSVRDSQCFCCTHGHVHPATREKMTCDRKAVYEALHRWQVLSESAEDKAEQSSGKETSSFLCMEEALDEFDDVVRSGLIRVLPAATTSRLLVDYRDVMYAAAPAVTWSALDAIFALCRDGRYLHALRWLLDYATLPLFVFPLAMVAASHAAALMERASLCSRPSRCGNALSSFVIAVAWVLVVIVLWLTGPLTASLNQSETPKLIDLFLVIRFVVLACMVRSAIRPRRSSTADASMDDFEEVVLTQPSTGRNTDFNTCQLAPPDAPTDRQNAPRPAGLMTLATVELEEPRGPSEWSEKPEELQSEASVASL
eukprot:TRINITY_DN22264_c1_g1_i1.p1 TRINITY_DN22264_c1_g1~~TRINITY_DN22264_c1_g1_i1.p1  ORF type:complete len:768 (-),score=64.42 TRINITY_DN22264_c1_g1_i1:10-2313(-)